MIATFNAEKVLCVHADLTETEFVENHPVGDDGQVVHEALVPLHIRSSIILVGLLI